MSAPTLNIPAVNTPAATQAPTMHPVTPSLAESLPLRDIHLPEPISWWPLAPGWWLVLAGIIFIVGLYFIVKKIRYSRRLKRASRDEFESIKNQYLNDKNENKLVKQLSIFLRRACISFYPRHDTAGLTGENWLNFLDGTLANARKQSSQTTGVNSASFNSANFNSDVGKVLLTAPYLPEDSSNAHINADALLELCERWLKAQPIKNRLENRLKASPTEENTASITSTVSNHSLATSELKQ